MNEEVTVTGELYIGNLAPYVLNRWLSHEQFWGFQL